jgi:hypothetical protein
MDQIRDYLSAIYAINRVERRLARVRDAAVLTLLDNALDAAMAAWLLIPAELRVYFSPPPGRDEYF